MAEEKRLQNTRREITMSKKVASKKVTTISLPAETLKIIEEAAVKTHRSVSGMIAQITADYVSEVLNNRKSVA